MFVQYDCSVCKNNTTALKINVSSTDGFLNSNYPLNFDIENELNIVIVCIISEYPLKLFKLLNCINCKNLNFSNLKKYI